ncbi:glycosyltransferase family 8 protein [Empedobacter brevis]|uniref:glycosyltransferase family 8 protein n=1 Tax=Empedobacter brevis TaxID=247 RepID=UPI00289DDBAD|nr:glycosyltransferase family 8 protein [Empedobacter brevis]
MNFLPIVLTCDDKYFKYANVVITSLLHNLNKNTNYEINILSEYISEKNQYITQNQVKKYQNVKVNFVKLETFDHNRFFLNSYMNVTTYYRFYIPELFSHYNRILYLDSDLIIDYDISNLANIHFDDKLALCCPSPFIVNKIKCQNDKDYPINYFTETLKMISPEDYFNAGVMVYNLHKINNENIGQKIFDSLQEIEKPKLQDQDLLNSVFNRYGGVKLLSQKYNNTRSYKITYSRLAFDGLKKILNIKIKHSKKLFYIYHYVGKEKPWKNNKIDSKLFYYYACKSPFKSEIIKENNKKLNFIERFLFSFI